MKKSETGARAGARAAVELVRGGGAGPELRLTRDEGLVGEEVGEPVGQEGRWSWS